MTKLVVSTIILFVCIIFCYASRLLHGRNIMAPLSFFGIYFFLTRIPRLIMAEKNLYGFHQFITEYMIWNYLLITIIFLAFVLIGAFLKEKIVFKQNRHYSIYKPSSIDLKKINYSVLFRVGVICFAIGAASRIFLIFNAGGLSYIWSHLYLRTELLEGYGYIDYLSICITFGLAAIEIYVLNCRKYKWIFIILCIMGIGLNLAFGARSPVMKMFMGLLFVYYFSSPDKISLKKIFNIKYLLLFLVLSVAIIILPTFRKSDFRFNSATILNSIKESSSSLGSFFDEISFYDEDVYTFNYFLSEPFWNGKSYLGLFTAWIPRFLYEDKPPIDDGMYLRTLMKGYKIVPPMSVQQMNAKTVSSSIPFTSNGILFANFGFFGSVLGGLLIGLIIVGQYDKMKRNGFMLEDILLYQFICTRLVLSTKGIVELLMAILMIRFFCGSIYRLSGTQQKIKFLYK